MKCGYTGINRSMNEFAYPDSIDILIEKLYNMELYIIICTIDQ